MDAAPVNISRLKKTLKLGRQVIFWILGIIAVVAIAWFYGGEEVKVIIFQVNPVFIGGLAVLQLFTLLMNAYQWYFLLGKFNSILPFSKVFIVCLAGSFVESVTPSSKVGGEAFKVYLFRRKTSLSYQEVTGVLVAHKYISLLPFILICAVVISMATLRQEVPVIVYLSFAAFGFFFAMLCFLIYRRRKEEGSTSTSFLSLRQNFLGEKLKSILLFIAGAAQHARYLTGRKDRFVLMSLSFVIWSLYPVKVFIAAAALGLNLEALTAPIATYFAYLVSMIPLLPGGLGTFEGSMAFMFSLGGLSSAEGTAVALLSRGITFWFPLLLSAGAAAYLSLENSLLFFKDNSSVKGVRKREIY